MDTKIQQLTSTYHKVDEKITQTMERIYLPILRWSIGIVYIWFGALKPLGLSPANELVRATVSWIFDPEPFILFLGIWEIAIGVFFIIPKFNRIAILLMALQMPGTILPLFILPQYVYVQFPFVLTLEGQYIVKNLVLIAAAISIGARVKEQEKVD